MADLGSRLADDLLTLDRELTEIDLLIPQARAEAARHEGRRAASADKIAAAPTDGDAKERLDQATSLVTLTRRAALMDSQVDVLEGKRRALARYRDAVADYIGAFDGTAVGGVALAVSAPGADAEPSTSPAVSRLVLGAQEDLRREIARAMHDGPAQSLTNIVLQAQIVEQVLARDPASASDEVRQLVSMVQHTLDATKSFIFDVRPMVLDDLGLVPTLRRATRDRGRSAGIPVEFDSLGPDRRLPMDLESGLFRILDEALAAYLAARPDRVTLRLDWGDQLEAHVAATRAVVDPVRTSRVEIPTEDAGKDLPPALASMLDDRRADERDAVQAAVLESIVELPPKVWREIQDRAASIGASAELVGERHELRLVTDIAAVEPTTER